MVKKVLIVEDKLAIIDLTERIIKGLGMGLETRVATNVEKALDVLNSGDIGLMLLDYNLEIGTKKETTDLVARAAYGLEVPFIFTSDDEVVYLKLEGYGAIRHLPKPFNLDDLENEIKKFYS